MASPLADACEAESIHFDHGELVVVAVWSRRCRKPCIETIHVDADDIMTVELHNEGVDRSSEERNSGVKYGSYAAAVVAWQREDKEEDKEEEEEERDLKFSGDTDGLL